MTYFIMNYKKYCANSRFSVKKFVKINENIFLIFFKFCIDKSSVFIYNIRVCGKVYIIILFVI